MKFPWSHVALILFTGIACTLPHRRTPRSPLERYERHDDSNRARIQHSTKTTGPAATTVALFSGTDNWSVQRGHLKTGNKRVSDKYNQYCKTRTTCSNTLAHRWKSLPSTAGCSGVLIHPRIIATSYHCVRKKGRRHPPPLGHFPRVVFNFTNDSHPSTVEQRQCFRGHMLIHGDQRGNNTRAENDWALLILSESVRPNIARPAKAVTSTSFLSDAPRSVVAYGHPLGTTRMSHSGEAFKCGKKTVVNVDLLQHSSGSPIFLRQGLLLGIAVVDKDSRPRKKRGCCRIPGCPRKIASCRHFGTTGPCTKDKIAPAPNFKRNNKYLDALIKAFDKKIPTDCINAY